MSYSRRLHAQVSHMEVAQRNALSQGFAYIISRMSRSSGGNSIPLFHSVAGWDRAAVLPTPSRTSQFLMEQGSDDSFGHSSGSSPAALEAS